MRDRNKVGLKQQDDCVSCQFYFLSSSSHSTASHSICLFSSSWNSGYIRDMSGVVLTEKKQVSIAMNVDSAMDKVVDDHAYDAIIATNRDGKILRVNEVAVKEFGYEKKSDLIGVHLALLMHGARDHPDYLLDSHGKQRVIVITRKDGTEMQCIVATRNIKGTPMVASYIRNLHPVKSSIMEVNSKED